MASQEAAATLGGPSTAAADTDDAADAFVSVADSLAHDVVGQPRTKNHYTFLRGRFVYKGPIAGKRLETMQTRPGWLAYWGTPLVVLPLATLQTADGVFFKFANLCAADGALESTPYTERTTGIAYRVLVRSGLVKMRELFADAALRDAMYAEHGRALLLALTHLYVLGAGDLGPQNVLARLTPDGTRVAALHVIDIEDSRMAELDATAPEFFLSKRQPAGYGLARLLPFYGVVADDVARLLDDPANAPHRARIELAVANLRRHAPPASGDTTTTTMTTTTTTTAAAATTTTTTAAAATTTTTTTAMQADVGALEIAAAVLGPPSVARASLAAFRGMQAGGTTYSGLALDVAKSALQKHVRRGETARALVVAVELWRMAEVEGGRAAQTNLYNRLAIIAAEDVGVANVPLCAAVADYVCGWGATGTSASPPARALDYLAAIVCRLCASPKTRLMSHLWRAYTTDEGTALARQRGLALDDAAAVLGALDATLAAAGTSVQAAWAPFAAPGDPADLCALGVVFARRLAARDHNAVLWAAKFLEAAHKRHAGRRGGRTVAAAMLWSVLRRHVAEEVAEPLAKAFYTLSEPRPFLMAAVAAVLFGVARPAAGAGPAATTTQLRAEAVAWSLGARAPLLAQLREGRYAAPTVDEHAVDMHTAAGRRRGKTRRDFVGAGTVIANEEPRFAVATLRAIYEDS